MVERNIRTYEETCFIGLLSSLINQTPIPRWNLSPQWDKIVSMAKNHNILNLLFYTSVGLDSAKTKWKKEVEEEYRNTILSDGAYEKILVGIIKAFEEKRVHCMILGGYNFKKYYPRPEMRKTSIITIYIDNSRRFAVDDVLRNLGFEQVNSNKKNEKLYFKLDDIWIKIVSQVSFDNKKAQKHFSKPINMYNTVKGFGHIHEMDKDELFTYKFLEIAQDFSYSKLQLQKLIDLWSFYAVEKDNLDMKKIEKDLEYLRYTKLKIYIMQILEYWFGKSFFPNEDAEYKALERFILTKGAQGVNFARSLIPLSKEKEIDSIEKEKKKTTKDNSWIFPSYEYMQSLYPALEKQSYLLPFFILKRLIRLFYRWLMNKIKSIYSTIKYFINLPIKKVKEITDKIKSKFNKENDENK